MKKQFFTHTIVLCMLLILSPVMNAQTKDASNPLLQKWSAPYEIPPFEKVKPEHYIPAYKQAMEEHNKEIKAILDNKKPPTFENTIIAYDISGKLLSKIAAVFGSVSGVGSNPEILAIAKELSPLTSKHFNDISLNETLFQKVKQVYDNRDKLKLDKAQMRLLTEMYKRFERNGANLPDNKKEEIKKLNSRIAELQLAFGQNLLAETANYTLLLSKEETAGLTENQLMAAESRAKKMNKEGYVFGLDNPSIIPFLESSENRKCRENILNAYLNRCNNNNDFDNKQVIKELIDLRLKKAQIMGFENFAQYQLQDKMAKTPGAVYELLDQLWGPALKAAEKEAADMEEIIKDHTIPITLESYDWRFFFEKSMKKNFELSDDQLRPYFKLENVREGIFYVCKQLYGITFTQLNNVPLPHPEATAWLCKDFNGKDLGVLFMDMFARPGEKRGGAWCGGFRSQAYERGKKIIPLVTIVCNFTRGIGNDPALLSTDETETYFHEFGHALASLLKDVPYDGLSGYTRDFVELPSQIMEHWAFEPEVLKVYAKHYKTGEIIPESLIDKLDKAGKYGQGFRTVEYLAASYLDMDYHILKSVPANFSVLIFEDHTLNNRGLIRQIPPRYRSTYFQHTFTGGYTAGYYSYIWAEVLDCDAYQAFVETGNIFDKATATKFRKEILEKANLEDAMDLYIKFRGKKPGIEPLLKNRGLN
jgi:peptidyl-dipeptidase Dcp